MPPPSPGSPPVTPGPRACAAPRRRLLAALAAPGLLAACGALPAIEATFDGPDVALQPDIPYGPAPRQRLSVYHPREAAPGAGRPVLVAFHGGLWQFGSRDELQMQVLGRRLAARGLVVVLADHRLHPEVAFPTFVEDGARAVGWAARNAPRFGGDPRLVFAAGHSSGAHIAVLLALDPAYLDAEGVRLAGAIGISGPYGAWIQANPLTGATFPPALSDKAAPMALAHGGAAPLLLLAGALDLLVRPGDSVELAARIRAAGGEAEARIYPLTDHFSIVLPLLPGPIPAHDDILGFIRRVTARRRGDSTAQRLALSRS